MTITIVEILATPPAPVASVSPEASDERSRGPRPTEAGAAELEAAGLGAFSRMGPPVSDPTPPGQEERWQGAFTRPSLPPPTPPPPHPPKKKGMRGCRRCQNHTKRRGDSFKKYGACMVYQFTQAYLAVYPEVSLVYPGLRLKWLWLSKPGKPPVNIKIGGTWVFTHTNGSAYNPWPCDATCPSATKVLKQPVPFPSPPPPRAGGNEGPSRLQQVG